MYDLWPICMSANATVTGRMMHSLFVYLVPFREVRICDIYPNYMSAIITPRVIQILFVYQYVLLDLRCVQYVAYLRTMYMSASRAFMRYMTYTCSI